MPTLDKASTLLITILVLMALLRQATPAYYFRTYDSPNQASEINAMLPGNKSTCDTAVTTRLGLCNNTCLICQSGDPSKCNTCHEGYYLQSTFCKINQTNYKYSQLNYIGTTITDAVSTISNFRYTSSNSSLTKNAVVSICSGLYELQVAGLFRTTDVVNLQFSRVDPIDQIRIKLNFVSLVTTTISFYITLNDNILFSKTYDSLADLSGVYVKNTNQSQRSYLYLESLNINTATSIFLPVDTTLTTYITDKYTIKFYVKTDSTNKYTWMFNDVVLFQRDSQTSVSQSVKDLLAAILQALLITSIILFVLILVLCLAMAYEKRQRKMEFQQKLGASSGNLPVKAIERVIEGVVRARKVRDKQINKQYRECQKVLKNNKPKKVQQPDSFSEAMNKLYSVNNDKEQ